MYSERAILKLREELLGAYRGEGSPEPKDDIPWQEPFFLIEVLCWLLSGKVFVSDTKGGRRRGCSRPWN